MVLRKFRLLGSWAIAFSLTSFASPSPAAAQSQPGGQAPASVMGVKCSRISERGIDKQMNLRAAMIMVRCGFATGGHPDTAPATVGRLSSVPSAPFNVNTITGAETYPKVTQSESTVWSSDGQTVVVNYNDSSSSPSNFSGVSVSTNGGLSWQRILPSPFATGHGTNFGDPILVFNAALGQWFGGDLVTGCGGFGIGLWTSTDGQNWDVGACAHQGNNDDRDSMWVDNNPNSPFYGRMYVSWNDFSASARLSVTHSDDGTTWSDPVFLSTGFIRDVQLTGSPSDGTVFVAGMDEGGGGGNPRTNIMYRSTDGGDTWTQIIMGAPFAPPGRFVTDCGSYFYAIAPIWRHMGWGQPGVGSNGVVHYAYAGAGANPDDEGDIYYTQSLDNGDTWSAPIILNSDQAAGIAREQWMPSLSVTTDGQVQVSWYDRRDTIDRSYEVWGIRSLDNGQTWLPDAPISNVVISQPEQPDPSVQLCYAGDYNYVTAFGGASYVTWTDGRNPVSGHFQQDVFFSRLGQLPRGKFVYTDNNHLGPNSVSAYGVAQDGTLTSVPGSPFVTGGTGSGGTFFSSARITIAAGNILYVLNGGSDDISAFSIDATTGILGIVPGSPFDTGGASGPGTSLVATPDNRFLFAANGLSQTITSFSINPDGSLSRIGSPISASGQPNGAKITPDGRFLAVVLPGVGPHGSVGVFSIGSDGTLVPAQPPQSVRPSGGPSGSATGIDISCDSATVILGEANAVSTLVDVFNLDPNSGLLTPVDGSPFNISGGVNSNVPLLSTDEAFLFVSNQNSNSITVLNVGPFSLNGVFPAGGTGQTPAGLATDQTGAHLYAAKNPGFVSVFNIGSDGSLTLAPNSPVSTGQGLGLLSLAAFPAKSCPVPSILRRTRP